MGTTLLPMLAALLISAAPADTMTTSYDVAGVRVIHRITTANEIVAVNLYLLGGSAQLDSASAGVEAMLLRASEYGTAGYPGRETRLALARTGSRITVQPEPDWTLFGFRGLREEFDSTWNVFAQRVTSPELNADAVELVRALMLRSVRSALRHPDGLARSLVRNIAFAGHPYAHDPSGTEESIRGLTADALRKYHATQFSRSRMLLVVVGNVERERVENAVRRSLARLPAGEYRWALPRSWAAARPEFTVHEQDLPTNYILGYFAGPASDARDYHAFRMATNLLSGLAHADIREHGLSYVGAAPFLERGASGGGIYVSTTRPDTTLRVFHNNIRYLRDNVFGRPALQRYYDQYLTEYHSLNESHAEQADFLARHELLRGDWRLAGRYMEDLKGVQGHEIRRAAREYMKNIRYVYVGRADRAPEAEMRKQ